MSPSALWLHGAVPVLVTALLARSLWAWAATETSARWLLTHRRAAESDPAPAPAPAPGQADAESPWLVVLLPMLREQTIATAAVQAFTALDYPRERAAVAVITTEREEAARRAARAGLPALAQRPLLPGDLRSLFPAARCPDVADAVNNAAPDQREQVLYGLYDAEPTTRHVVAAAAGDLPAGRLRLAHLHQGDVPGRKAGQLNTALDQLDRILGPLGWTETDHAEHTYLIVYDADALPDTATLHSFARTARAHRARTGSRPALIQQQRLPLAARRPFPPGPTGLLLAGEWIYQLRRSLGIELARLRLNHWLTRTRLPELVRTLLRPMIYAVGCGMAVHLPALRALGGFPEPMEDLGTGHRLSLLGADITPTGALVLDEPYTDPAGLTNLHALAFTASARPDRHAAATAHLPSRLTRTGKAALIAREWADEAAWLLGAPLAAAAVVSSWRSGPWWAALAATAVLLHGPVLTARLHSLAPALRAATQPPLAAPPAPTWPRAALIAASPLQPFVRLAGPWRLIAGRIAGRRHHFGKTER